VSPEPSDLLVLPDQRAQSIGYDVERYQGNTLRVWFTPEEIAAAGIDKPLAEVPMVKDKWITHDAEVLTYPRIGRRCTAQWT
jgi:hypothetical protein